MKTVEKINNEWVEIDWSFEEIQERLDHNWADWSVRGEGSDGKIYWGNCQASTTDPNESHDTEIYYLEEIKEETPA